MGIVGPSTFANHPPPVKTGAEGAVSGLVPEFWFEILETNKGLLNP